MSSSKWPGKTEKEKRREAEEKRRKERRLAQSKSHKSGY